MKYVITGAAGNISKPLTKLLLNAGHTVTVIGRSEANLKDLAEAGAKLAIGSVEDIEFLKKTFKGADAIYTMYPPGFTTPTVKEFNAPIANNYKEAIKDAGIKYVVNLSSVGAHLTEGSGHIAAVAHAEQILNTLDSVHIKHLRAAFFYTNLLWQIEMIKQNQIMGGSFSIPANKFPVAAPVDVATVAAEELLSLNFTGHSVRYIVSDETGTMEIANIIGKAIGKDQLPWIKFTDQQAQEGMMQNGFSREMAEEFIEAYRAIDSGLLFTDYWNNRPEELGVTKLRTFAKQFASIYQTV